MYLYTFAGTPRVREANEFGSASRVYFLKHGNQMLIVDDKLRSRAGKDPAVATLDATSRTSEGQ